MPSRKTGWSISVGMKLWLPLAVLLLPVGSTVAGGGGGGPVPVLEGAAPLAQVPRVVLPAVDRQAAEREDDRRSAAGEPDRFAEPRQVLISPDRDGSWEMLSDGRRLWRLRVACPGALSLNLGFSVYRLPPGAQLVIADAAGQGPVQVFDADDNREHGQLWTPVVVADELVVALLLPAGAVDWDLVLTRIGCGYRFFGEPAADKAGTCNVDVVCDEGDSWRDQIASVGVYTVNGSWTCTGAMVNNTAQDERPLFLTANHCGVGAGQAPTVVVYWNFESPVCGQQGGGSLEQSTSGATLLASYAGSDFTLLELAAEPDPDFGVKYAGWDRSGQVPASAVAIHHPSCDEKSISFENDPLSLTTYLSDASPGDGTHLRVADWDLGTTEVGSSGSPLFNTSGRIVGQLHGGYAACGNNLPDWYGRLSRSWTGGASSATSLASWLDPEGLGSLTLDLLDPAIGPPPADSARVRITGLAPNPFLEYVEVTVDLQRSAWTTARVYDLAGRLAADLGGATLAAGENVIPWDGYGAGGQRLPAGVYVLVVAAEGGSARRSLVRLN